MYGHRTGRRIEPAYTRVLGLVGKLCLMPITGLRISKTGQDHKETDRCVLSCNRTIAKQTFSAALDWLFTGEWER